MLYVAARSFPPGRIRTAKPTFATCASPGSEDRPGGRPRPPCPGFHYLQTPPDLNGPNRADSRAAAVRPRPASLDTLPLPPPDHCNEMTVQIAVDGPGTLAAIPVHEQAEKMLAGGSCWPLTTFRKVICLRAAAIARWPPRGFARELLEQPQGPA
jgi:hypothetical protein